MLWTAVNSIMFNTECYGHHCSQRSLTPNVMESTDLNEVCEQRAAELLLQDVAVVSVAVAARDESREEHGHKARVAEVLEGQGTQLLQDCGRLTSLHDRLGEKEVKRNQRWLETGPDRNLVACTNIYIYISPYFLTI